MYLILIDWEGGELHGVACSTLRCKLRTPQVGIGGRCSSTMGLLFAMEVRMFYQDIPRKSCQIKSGFSKSLTTTTL